jgi:hypothetical protein
MLPVPQSGSSMPSTHGAHVLLLQTGFGFAQSDDA